MNCDQFTADIAEILSWLRNQGSLSEGPFTEGEAAAFPYDDVVGDDELTPAEAAACAVAQLWFEWGYQVITEHVLPATRFGFDYLVPAVTAFIVGAIGGPPAALGAYAVAEFIQELLEILYNGAETNLINWMTTNKQDIVCLLFYPLIAGGDASAIWQVVEDNLIDASEDISAGDKLILHLFMGSWAGSNALRAFNAETEWATSNVVEGYCVDCEPIPGPLFHEWAFPPDEDWDVTDPNAWYSPYLYTQYEGKTFSPVFEPVPGTYDISIHTRGRNDQAGHWCDFGIQRSDDGETWVTWLDKELTRAASPTWTTVDWTWTSKVWEWTYMRYRWWTYVDHGTSMIEISGTWTPA